MTADMTMRFVRSGKFRSAPALSNATTNKSSWNVGGGLHAAGPSAPKRALSRLCSGGRKRAHASMQIGDFQVSLSPISGKCRLSANSRGFRLHSPMLASVFQEILQTQTRIARSNTDSLGSECACTNIRYNPRSHPPRERKTAKSAVAMHLRIFGGLHITKMSV